MEITKWTVATQLQQAIAGIQSAVASMKTYALETQDQQAKQTFQQLAKNFDEALYALQQRQHLL